MQERFDGASTREGEEAAVLILLELGGPFEEREEQGGGVRLGSRGMWQSLRAQGMRQDRGGTGQEEPQGIGQASRRRGAVAVEITLDGLAIVFTSPTRAVACLIQPRWRRGHQGGAHKAWGIAGCHHCGFAADPPRLGPGGRGRGKLGIQTAAGWRACAMGLREGGALLVQPARLLEDGFGLAQQDGIASPAEDTIDPSALGQHLEHFGGGKRAVPPDEDRGPWPVPPPHGEETPQEHGIVSARGARAWAPTGSHQGV
jgi:hypothetical protein